MNKKYLVLGQFNGEGLMYSILNAEDELECMKKVQKIIEENKVDSTSLSLLSPIEITDEEQLNFVIPTGIAKIED